MTARDSLTYFRRRREIQGCRFVTGLWNEVYRGVQVGRLWFGWTNPTYKARGW